MELILYHQHNIICDWYIKIHNSEFNVAYRAAIQIGVTAMVIHIG